jgi:outer membrane protein insertion porin family
VARRAGALLVLALLGPISAEAEEPSSDPRYLIECIEVLGNQRTREQVIRDNLLVREGQILNEDLVTLSRLKLMNLGLFYDVRTRLRRGSRKGHVILVFEVSERNAIMVEELFIGGTARTPFWGGFGVSDHNFLGRGHWLHGAWVLSGDQQAYRLDYFAPSIAGTPLLLGGGLLYTRGLEVFSVVPTRPSPTPETDISPRVDYERLGGYLTAGVKFGGFNRALFDYRFEALRAFAGAGLTTPGIARGKSRLTSLSAVFERDTRDHPNIPTHGHRLRLSVELGSQLLGGSYEFSKYLLQWAQLLPAHRTHAFRLDASFGLIQGDTPFFNKFFFGDTSFFSLRYRAVPRALGLNFSKESFYDEVLFSTGLEYALPIPRMTGPANRGYLFFATNATYTASIAETLGQKDRPWGSGWSLSFDLGVKLDTVIGFFTFSVAYVLDVFL